jgi:hypothetical protein
VFPTTLLVVNGLLIAAEAAAAARSDVTFCFDHPGTPLWLTAMHGVWLTVGAMVVITGFHLLRSHGLRRWIAERWSTWTLRHAPTRPSRRHPAHRS